MGLGLFLVWSSLEGVKYSLLFCLRVLFFTVVMLLYYVWFIYYTGVAIYKGSISVFLVVCREIYISVLGIRFVA